MKKYIFPIILTIGIALRILLIWNAPLWYDENFTVILTRLPFDKMLAATAGDVHPPLWYIIEWITFHATPWPAWTMRLWSCVFSSLSLVAFWRLMRVMSVPPNIKWLAFAFMSLMPFQIWYAQEARMYALLEFLVLATLYNALTKHWIRFAVAATLMLYTQNYGVFYLVAIWIVIGIYQRGDIIWKAFVASLASLVAFLPWVKVIADQVSEINGRYWIMDSSVGGALGILQRLFFGSILPGTWAMLSHVLVFIVLIIGVWWLITSVYYPFKWALMIMAFMPLALAWSASIVWQPLLLFRPLIGSAPFLYLIAAGTLASIINLKPSERKWTTAYASALIVPLLAVGLVSYYRNVSTMKGSGDTRPMLEVLAYIREHWQPGDVIYHTDDGSLVNFMPYTADLPQYRMPPCEDETPVLGSLSVATRTAMNVQVADLKDITYTRAWVLAPKTSPLHPQCYMDQIAPITQGDPLIKVDDNNFIQSGLWLVEQ